MCVCHLLLAHTEGGNWVPFSYTVLRNIRLLLHSPIEPSLLTVPEAVCPILPKTKTSMLRTLHKGKLQNEVLMPTNQINKMRKCD